MLNINQNFDLKAPVFNFDRDYFNSVEELNAYDTSNVPNHFVTNVAGMLYQFTDGAWVPMIQASYGDPEDPEYHGCSLSLIDDNCFVSKNPDDNMYQLYLGTDDDTYVDISSSSSIEMKSTFSGYPQISINQEIDGVYKRMWIGNSWDTGFGLNIEHQKYLDSLLQYSKYIKIFIDKELTEQEQEDGYSQADISLTDANNSANINAGHGFMHKTEDGFTSHLDGEALDIRSQVGKGSINSQGLSVYDENNKPVICLQSFEENSLTLGSDEKFKISRQLDNTEGGVISGIKSLTAFANPSATKVWATDGSTVDLSTKANASDLDAKANKSDVLLKKSTTGGYYIEANRHELGNGAFATNDMCTASADYSHAEGTSVSSGSASHAEGVSTEASGMGSHAEGVRNVIDKNAIHSVGIGEILERKNAEYIYVKNNDDGTAFVDDPKNGYKYLIGVGGYDGISTDNTTYKSVQEVIADLTARIEQLETKVKALEAANTPA